MATKSAKRSGRKSSRAIKKFPHAKVDALEAKQIETYDDVPRAILTAASQAFSKWGFVKTGLTDIARSAGTSRANIYNYFPKGKEEILRELLRIKNTAFDEQFSKSYPLDGPASEIFRKRIICGIQHVHQDDLILELIANDQTAHVRQLDVVAAAEGFWNRLFEYAAERGELRPGVAFENGFRWIYLVISSLLYVSQPQGVGSIEDINEQVEKFLIPSLCT